MNKILAMVAPIVMSASLIATASPAYANYDVYIETGPVKRTSKPLPGMLKSRILADPEKDASLRTFKTQVIFQYKGRKKVSKPGEKARYKPVWKYVPGSKSSANNINYRSKNMTDGYKSYSHQALAVCPVNDAVTVRVVMTNVRVTTWNDREIPDVVLSHSTDPDGFRVDCRI